MPKQLRERQRRKGAFVRNFLADELPGLVDEDLVLLVELLEQELLVRHLDKNGLRTSLPTEATSKKDQAS